MATQAIISIDPGASGGWAEWEYTNKRYQLVDAYKFEDWATTVAEITKLATERYCFTSAIIEQVQGHIGKAQPGAAMFKFGENYGKWQGLLMGLAVPFERVTPQKWQKGLDGLGKLKGADRKRALRTLAIERHPMISPTLATCDAILIGDWYVRQLSATYAAKS